uniref:Uncharacterized protein n=1 Tax=Panagrolaimus sp. ES5 TaxID=591445 RepID=A0AC34F2P2_9BILA
MAWTKISLLFFLGYLTLIIATTSTEEQQQQQQPQQQQRQEQQITNDNIQVPYEIYGKRSANTNEYSPYYPEGSYDLESGIRLKKWATQLRFEKAQNKAQKLTQKKPKLKATIPKP